MLIYLFERPSVHGWHTLAYHAGEWWLDRESGQLFIFPPGPNPGPLEVSVPIAMPAAVSAAIGEYGPVLVYFEGLHNVKWDGIGMG